MPGDCVYYDTTTSAHPPDSPQQRRGVPGRRGGRRLAAMGWLRPIDVHTVEVLQAARHPDFHGRGCRRADAGRRGGRAADARLHPSCAVTPRSTRTPPWRSTSGRGGGSCPDSRWADHTVIYGEKDLTSVLAP
ncbi:hypothetical protein [Nonomuraea dietziae]|uniref:hypothetical protein n=1 Tax=Nonomuraea dietziae TaxID=65515 RepID=UPI0031CF3555